MKKNKVGTICPLCESSNLEEVYSSESAYFSNSERSMMFLISQCKDCGYVFQGSAYSKQYDEIIKKVYAEFRKSDLFEFPRRSRDNIDKVNLIIGKLPKKKY